MVCTPNRRKPPSWAVALLEKMEQLQEGMESLMSLVTVDDAELAQLGTDLSTAVASVGTELTDLEAKLAAAIAAGTPVPAGSLDGVKAALTSLQALEVPAPTPAPAPEPTPPPVTPPADVPPAV